MDKNRKSAHDRFTRWRESKGLSYQDIVEKVNANVGMPVLKYATVVSWGTRGSRPRKSVATLIANVFPDCPVVL